MTPKKRRARCENHKASERSWDEYEFAYTDYKGTHIYRCHECHQKTLLWLKKYDLKKRKEEIERQEKVHKFYSEIYEREQEFLRRRKEELWDSEIKRILTLGLRLKGRNKYDYQESIPKEVLQLTRAIIKLQRLIQQKSQIHK